MKKLVLAFMMGAAAMAANAQVNYKVQTACHPQDVKHYDTELLRSRFMMDKVMACSLCSHIKRSSCGSPIR